MTQSVMLGWRSLVGLVSNVTLEQPPKVGTLWALRIVIDLELAPLEPSTGAKSFQVTG